MEKYAYTIFDANPANSGSVAWPSHDEVEIEASSPEEALVAGLKEARKEGEASGAYNDGDELWVIVWDDDGIIVAEGNISLSTDYDEEDDEIEESIVREGPPSKQTRPGLIIAYWDTTDPNNLGWSWRAFWYDRDGEQTHEESGGFDGRKSLSDETITRRARSAAGHGGSRVPVEIRE
jgi:hypothetical protein